MNNSLPALTPLVALFCITAAQAAGMNDANVTRDYTDVVAPAEQQAYEAGVKAYNQCLRQHNFKYAWRAWEHETGNTYTYSYTTDPLAWGDFDTMHTAGKACESVWMSSANPHLLSETSSFYTLAPGFSHMPQGLHPSEGLVEIIEFKLKEGQTAYDAFTSSVKSIFAAVEKTQRPGAAMMLEVQDAGPGAPDFILVLPHNSWADLGKKVEPPLWTMMANVYGAKKAQEIHKTLGSAVERTSSHVDSYDADLTYMPASH